MLQCSRTCGSGIKFREVVCPNGQICDLDTEPNKDMSCNIDLCPITPKPPTTYTTTETTTTTTTPTTTSTTKPTTTIATSSATTTTATKTTLATIETSTIQASDKVTTTAAPTASTPIFHKNPTIVNIREHLSPVQTKSNVSNELNPNNTDDTVGVNFYSANHVDKTQIHENSDDVTIGDSNILFIAEEGVAIERAEINGDFQINPSKDNKRPPSSTKTTLTKSSQHIDMPSFDKITHKHMPLPDREMPDMNLEVTNKLLPEFSPSISMKHSRQLPPSFKMPSINKDMLPPLPKTYEEYNWRSNEWSEVWSN